MIEPTIYYGIGDEFRSHSLTIRCIERGEVKYPRDVCRGCVYMRRYWDCTRLKCSKADRRDGKDVWFEEVE